jgi:hypothetical protein
MCEYIIKYPVNRIAYMAYISSYDWLFIQAAWCECSKRVYYLLIVFDNVLSEYQHPPSGFGKCLLKFHTKRPSSKRRRKI